MDLREWNRWVHEHTNRKSYQKILFPYNEDARQDEKHVPDLLEAIIQPPDPVKEELRPNSFKITQFGSKIKNFKVSTFWQIDPITAHQTRIIPKNAGFKRLDLAPPGAFYSSTDVLLES